MNKITLKNRKIIATKPKKVGIALIKIEKNKKALVAEMINKARFNAFVI